MSRLFPKFWIVQFAKWHACGNDFIITDSKRMSREADIFLCDRHKGIGADGIIYVKSSEDIEVSDADVVFVNADGTEAEMCGNGIRCAGEFIRDHIGWWSTLRLSTKAGVKTLHFYKRCKRIGVDMGSAELNWSREIEVRSGNTSRKYDASYVNIGNPHCILFVNEEDVQHGEVERFGSKIEKMTELFPEGTNVEFLTIRDREHMRMRVWERGVGRTLACGTGSCASAYAAYERGLIESHVNVELDGGEVEVEIQEDNLHLIGPATFIYKGEYVYVYEPMEED